MLSRGDPNPAFPVQLPEDRIYGCISHPCAFSQSASRHLVAIVDQYPQNTITRRLGKACHFLDRISFLFQYVFLMLCFLQYAFTSCCVTVPLSRRSCATSSMAGFARSTKSAHSFLKAQDSDSFRPFSFSILVQISKSEMPC